jgi:three-Cys-motif partner protein
VNRSQGPATTTWPMEPHTKAKHDLIRRYLGGWFPILGTYNGRVVYLDGFAGPGIYSDGSEGSPLIAIKTLLDHAFFPRLSCEFIFVFVEPFSDRAESLRSCMTALIEQRGGLPKNVKYFIFEDTFETRAEQIIDLLETQKSRLAPTFALIDPFGFSGVPMETVARLLAFDKCEVFFNFMYDHINRFVTAGNVDQHLEKLFGSQDYKDVQGLSPSDRRVYLHELYARQLRSVCKFNYVQHFSMIRRDRHLVYSLFFGTRDLSGLRVMKGAMWALAPGDGNVFQDQFAGLDVLFQPTPDVTSLRRDLTNHFAGRTVTVEEIDEYTLVNTPFSSSHWNRLVLNPLEKEGIVEVVASPRKRKGSFPPGTLVRFN